VCGYFAGLANVQFKSRDIHYQYERNRVVILIDCRAEDAP
jgi:hypothetical protein